MKLWKRKADLAQNLKRRLPQLATEYFEAGRSGLAEGSSWEEMHRFRLLTKRFRYTLEIFRDAYGPGLNTRVEALRSVQTQLGEINDRIVTGSMLQGVAGTESVREKLAREAEQRTAKLRRWWQREFDAPGKLESWARYLGTYACRRQPLPRTRRIPAPAPEVSGNDAVVY